MSIATAEAGCPSCGVIRSRVHSRRPQRLRDIPVAGPVEVLWAKRRFFCDEYLCPRQTFSEETSPGPAPGPVHPPAPGGPGGRRHRFRPGRRRGRRFVRGLLVAGPAGPGLRGADAARCRRPAPRMLGIDEHRYRSVRFFRDPATKAWKRYEPWMTTIVDLDTGQVLGIVDGRDSEGVGDWLFARPLQWRLGVQVVAIDPSAAFRKALRMWLPRTAVSVDAFHLVKLGNDMLTEVRQRLSQQVQGRRGRAIDPAWANRRLLLRAGDTLSDRARNRLSKSSPPTTPPASCKPRGWSRNSSGPCCATGSLADAAAAKDRLQVLVEQAAQPETNRL